MAKTILITGASSGIGRATALYFAERGWNVAATMRDPSKADPVLHHPQISLFALDVTDADSIAQAIAETLTRYQKIDVLLNNAGYGLFGPHRSTGGSANSTAICDQSLWPDWRYATDSSSHAESGRRPDHQCLFDCGPFCPSVRLDLRRDKVRSRRS